MLYDQEGQSKTNTTNNDKVKRQTKKILAMVGKGLIVLKNKKLTYKIKLNVVKEKQAKNMKRKLAKERIKMDNKHM